MTSESGHQGQQVAADGAPHLLAQVGRPDLVELDSASIPVTNQRGRGVVGDGSGRPPQRCALAREQPVDLADDPRFELLAGLERLQEEVHRRRLAVLAHHLAEQEIVSERALADGGELGGVGRDGEQQVVGGEDAVAPFEVRDRGEAHHPRHALDRAAGVGEPLDRVEDVLLEDVLALDHDREDRVLAEGGDHVLVEADGGIALRHQPAVRGVEPEVAHTGAEADGDEESEEERQRRMAHDPVRDRGHGVLSPRFEAADVAALDELMIERRILSEFLSGLAPRRRPLGRPPERAPERAAVPEVSVFSGRARARRAHRGARRRWSDRPSHHPASGAAADLASGRAAGRPAALPALDGVDLPALLPVAGGDRSPAAGGSLAPAGAGLVARLGGELDPGAAGAGDLRAART